MKPSHCGVVASMSDVTSVMAGLSVGKPDDSESVTNSAFETCSGFSGATSAGVSQSSEVSCSIPRPLLMVMTVAGYCIIPNSMQVDHTKNHPMYLYMYLISVQCLFIYMYIYDEGCVVL